MTSGYRQGFVSQTSEIEVEALPIRGTVPQWLNGVLLRNGPAQFEAGEQRFRHWFDGLAMLHKFGFQDGQVSYANKFLESPHFTYVREHGKIGYSEFATDPCRSIFKRITSMFQPGGPQFGVNASVSISKLTDRFVAWTETPLPMEFDPDTLRTVGVVDFGDDLNAATTTPHPHLDASSGDAINSSIHFGRSSAYVLYRIPADGGPRQSIAVLPVDEPAYMHSFSLTPNYIVLAEYPLVVSPLKLLLSGKPFADNLTWHPERDTTFLVFRITDGSLVGRYRCSPFFCFHHVNAFERDGTLVVDLLAYPDSQVIRSMYLDELLKSPKHTTPVPAAELRRYAIDLEHGHVAYEVLTDECIELPRINYERHHTLPYRYVYATGLRKDQPYDFSNQLVKVDTQERAAYRWFEDNCYPGEPIFVPSPGAGGEDDGVVLSVVLDARTNASFLLILDAQTFAEIGRATVPQRIPFGFHGQFFDDTTMRARNVT